MQRVLSTLLASLLLVSAPLAADHQIFCLGVPISLSAEGSNHGEPRPVKGPAVRRETALNKVDFATDTLLVPYFEVDTNSASGTTTLFAVRNVTEDPLFLTVAYFDVFNNFQTSSNFIFGDKDTLTINVRDVAGLATDPDGFKRGMVVIEAAEAMFDEDKAGASNGEAPVSEENQVDKGIALPGLEPSLIVGDYFQLIPGEDFATGDRLLNLNPTSRYHDMCSRLETRYFDGGAFSGGTDLTFIHSSPQGAGDFDPSSFDVAIYDENGELQATCDVVTDQSVLLLNSQDFPGPTAGTLEIRVQGGEGALISEFNALGRFSVGMRAACIRNILEL